MLVCFPFFQELVVSQNTGPLLIQSMSANETSIVLESSVHEKYGFAYPVTYQFDIPQNSSGMIIHRKYFLNSGWTEIQEKNQTDYFNAIEAVRFDYMNNRAYVSVSFSDESDSIFLKFSSGTGSPIAVQYQGISKYYDNRQAAVTVSADDWADWSDSMWDPLLTVFRSHGLYVTVGIITDSAEWCSPQTWKHIQQQSDSGYIEVASHSGTHPHVPYVNINKEVLGSHDDIVKNLTLPALFRKGNKEFVYVWIAPYGEYDKTIDSLLQHRTYIVPRLYVTGDITMTNWNNSKKLFDAIGLTLEIGLPSWGGGTADTTFMNGTFNAIVQSGGVYHLMWHPQVIYADRTKPYLLKHLAHISQRKDIWYANLGHLYLYRLLRQLNNLVVTHAARPREMPTSMEIFQNYPNPFNPNTTIKFQIPERSSMDGEMVSLTVFNILGKKITMLANERIKPGIHEKEFDASHLPSGMYFYRLSAGNFVETKKMLLLK